MPLRLRGSFSYDYLEFTRAQWQVENIDMINNYRLLLKATYLALAPFSAP